MSSWYPKIFQACIERVRVSAPFLFLIAGCVPDGSSRSDNAIDDTAPADTSDDSSTADQSTSSAEDTATETDSGVVCEGACEMRDWTTCTCAPEDPCGWSGDKFCDGYCIERGIVALMFDDS